MALRSANIIGDVVDDVQESGIKLEVRFGTVQVEDGATLKPAQVGVSCECTLHAIPLVEPAFVFNNLG